jgi:hypothetical protein
MRKNLLWTLGATGVLSAWALLNPTSQGATAAIVVAAARHAPGPAGMQAQDRHEPAAALATSAGLGGASPHDASPTAPLPASWPRLALEPAARSPFLPPAPPPPVIAQAAPPPPPPPPPPTLTYRFWGSMTAPDGHDLLYIAHGDNAAPVAAAAGTRLEDGFVIEKVGAQGIEFVHEPTQQHFTLATPPPENVGVR